MLKMEIKSGKCHVEGDYLLHGSVIQGTVNVDHQGFRTHLEIESDEDENKIAHLINCAKGGCFAEKLIVQPVPLEGKVTVNGKELEI